MFTGIIEEIARVVAVEPLADRAVRLRVATSLPPKAKGASFALDGVCLTLTDFHPTAPRRWEVTMTCGFETLARTTLGKLVAGDHVNAERPLRVGDELGGHLVTGHVDGIGRLRERRAEGPSLWVAIDAPAALRSQIVAKGSITVDGISLTVNGVDADGFTVGIVPHTLTHTTLGDKTVGAELNLETDLIGKYVERQLAARGAGYTSR
jgi:riboflavin synthase